jgi:hypothetical protein
MLKGHNFQPAIPSVERLSLKLLGWSRAKLSSEAQRSALTNLTIIKSHGNRAVLPHNTATTSPASRIT